MAKKIIFWLLLIVLLGVGIGYFLFNHSKAGGAAAGNAVARVGRAVLAEQDLRERIPPEYSDFITREQNIDYVKRWIDAEVLYQTALARDVDKEPEIRSRIRKMKRDLLVSEMISRLSSQTADVSDDDIEKYYQENVEKFTRTETDVKYVHLCVRTLAEAWKIRQQVTPDNFLELARQYSLDPVADPGSQPYLTRNEIMPELAEVIFDIKVGGTTPPIKTPFGYYLVKIIDKQLPGTLRPVESVREQIISHLSSQTQKTRLDEIVADMRKNLVIEYNPALVPGRVDAPVPETKPAPAPKPVAPVPAPKPAPAPAAKAPVAPPAVEQ